MLGAPVKAFHAVGGTGFTGIAADPAQQVHMAAAGHVDVFAFAMTVFADRQHGIGAVFFLAAPDLAGDDRGGFFPRNALEFAFTAVVGVHLCRVAAGFPVHSFEWIFDTVGRIQPVFITQRKIGGLRFFRALKRLALCFQFP